MDTIEYKWPYMGKGISGIISLQFWAIILYEQGFGAGQSWHGSGFGYNYKTAPAQEIKEKAGPAPLKLPWLRLKGFSERLKLLLNFMRGSNK